jgi:hypothetical protein
MILPLLRPVFTSAQNVFVRLDATSFVQKTTANRHGNNRGFEAYNLGGLVLLLIVVSLLVNGLGLMKVQPRKTKTPQIPTPSARPERALRKTFLHHYHLYQIAYLPVKANPADSCVVLRHPQENWFKKLCDRR